ncbi:hypothetical protein ACFO0N_01290 [Halobium salinum]|uniref:DUF7344 domain-containing protein n=1 Tax=Halobium salinum TaxID=1364940 RepID=A0ABD5P7E0_9EURY|nr:hypothetical protein [Halobium salinum]
MAESQTARPSGAVETEEVFQTLSNQRRRFVVHALEQDGSMEIGDMARRIAGWEYQKDPEAVSSAERRRVYNSLQQVHLPKMDENGLVDYDSRSGLVSATGDLADLRLYLEVVPGNDIPWSTYYLLLGAFGALFATATLLNVFGFGAVPDAVGALTTGVLLVASAAVHTYVTRTRELGVEGPPPEVDEG